MTTQEAEEWAHKITGIIEEFVRAEAEAVALRVVRDREKGKFSYPEESEPISITRRGLEEVLRDALKATVTEGK